MTEPLSTELDQRFSGADAKPSVLGATLSGPSPTLASTGSRRFATILRPHVTPLIGLFIDDTFYFCTGPGEQKAKNIVDNSNCAVVTGSNTYGEGLDIVVEGNAERVVEQVRLVELAREYEAKYGAEWHFEVRDSAFHHGGRRGVGLRGHAGQGTRLREGRPARANALAVRPHQLTTTVLEARSALGSVSRLQNRRPGSGGAKARSRVAFAPAEPYCPRVLAEPGLWRVLAGLMFTAYAFTMAWRFFRRQRRRRR